jgi:hypothetical protein
MPYVVNPETGRKIKVGGPTYNRMMKTPSSARKLKSARKTSAPKSSGKRAKPGCSNQNKYPRVPKDKFCGPEGGACSFTYPVNTPARARAALAYARHAPLPEGIRKCAMRIAKNEGWVDPQTGHLRM